MGRPIRVEYPSALYHITSRGNERKRIFAADEDRIKFLNILEEYHDRYGILIHGYILMDNHYHLILETPKGNLLKVMHGINSGYTGYFNRKYGRSGHLFQGRYRGILVEKDGYLLPLSRYVHLNPVRAGLVGRPEDYRWSSYRSYIGRERESPWIEYSWVLGQFGKAKKIAQKRYQRYTDEGLRDNKDSPFKSLYGQVLLGGEEFIGKVKGMLRERRLPREIVERKRLVESPSPMEIVGLVSRVFGVKHEELLERRRTRYRARKVAIYVCQRYTGLSNKAIGDFFGGIHESAVSKITYRIREEMGKDKTFSKLVSEVLSIFKA